MGKRYKIIVVSNYADTQSARPEAEVFLSLKKAGVEMTILTQKASFYGQKFQDAGIKVIDHTPRSKISWQTIKLIRRTIENARADAIFLYNSKAIVNGLLASIGCKTKTVLYRGCAGNIKWYDPSMYFKYLSPFADYILCNDDAARDLIQKNLLFKKERAFTIRKGHDTSWFSKIQGYNLSEFCSVKNAFVITCMANARPVKGIEYLLKAMHLIPEELNVHLLLLGKGLDSEYHKTLAGKLMNNGRIQFLGFTEKAHAIIKGSQAFVLPSIDQETLTKSVIEAMAMEVCPVISDIEGNKFLMVENKTGLSFPIKNPQAIAEQIIKLASQPNLATQMGQNAKLHIERHLNHQQTVEAYLNFIKTL